MISGQDRAYLLCPRFHQNSKIQRMGILLSSNDFCKAREGTRDPALDQSAANSELLHLLLCASSFRFGSVWTFLHLLWGANLCGYIFYSLVGCKLSSIPAVHAAKNSEIGLCHVCNPGEHRNIPDDRGKYEG